MFIGIKLKIDSNRYLWVSTAKASPTSLINKPPKSFLHLLLPYCKSMKLKPRKSKLRPDLPSLSYLATPLCTPQTHMLSFPDEFRKGYQEGFKTCVSFVATWMLCKHLLCLIGDLYFSRFIHSQLYLFKGALTLT